ncbi:MAG: internal scaffolding protein [Microviridae sp.]|nr:MAG: internal scaffolding protein [Microviridae sp.]
MSYNPKNPRPISQIQPLLISNYSQKTFIGLDFSNSVSLTKQEFKDECDINVLMSKYMSTGELPVINERMPQYLDVTGYDFQASMEFIANAQSMFQELPSVVRNRFQNDPAQFLDFCSNENNHEEMAKMGLLKPQNEWSDPSIHLKNKNAPDVNTALKEAAKNSPVPASPESQKSEKNTPAQ